jgi:hypothetical protein
MGRDKKRPTTPHVTAGNAANRETPFSGQAPPAEPPGVNEPTMQRVLRLAAAGSYQKALGVLSAHGGRDDQLRNARGVCLLRLGKVEEAIRLYRELVLKPGCMWARPELPVHYKTNYATALLLGGHPAGGLDVLAEIKDEQDPRVRQLRAAIKKWESELSFWQKLNWKIGSISPTNRPVKLDFEPGEFGAELVQPPQTTRTPRGKDAA